MKLNLKILVCMAVLVLSIGMVTSANLSNHDFGNFTMDIPDDAQLDEKVEMFAGTVITGVSSTNIGSGISKALKDPSNTHPIWIENKTNMTIGYYDLKEDNITDENTLINKSYSEASLIKEENGYKIYDISKCTGKNNNTILVTKVKEGFLFTPGDSMVTIEGKDEDSLKGMIETVKFN